MAVRIDLDEPDLKTIIRGLTVLLLEIEKSPDVVQAMLEDNKRYVNSLKEKMERYLEGEKALKEKQTAGVAVIPRITKGELLNLEDTSGKSNPL